MDTPEQVKIWQRVRGETPPITDGLPGLAAGALTQAAQYGALARQMQGPGRRILVELQEEELENTRCIKGIYRLVTGKSMSVAAVPPTTEHTEAVLRKSYGRSLKALNAYETRASHSEYGAIFSYLADRQRTHCCKIAQLMGLLGV